MTELHARTGPSRGKRSEYGHITELFCQWHLGLDDPGTCPGIHSFNLSAPFVQVGDHITHILFGCDNLYGHDGFKHYRVRFGSGVLKCLACADLKRELVGIHRMERTIYQAHFQSLEGESCKRTIGHGILKSLFHGWNILPGNSTSPYFVYEFKSFVIIGRTDKEFNIGEFTTATSLLLEGFAMLHLGGQCLFVVHLRCTYVALYLELTLQSIHQDLQVQFTHSVNGGLSAFHITTNLESRIFFSQFAQCYPHLINVSLGLGLNGDPDDSIRKFDGFKDHGFTHRSDGIPCPQLF